MSNQKPDHKSIIQVFNDFSRKTNKDELNNPDSIEKELKKCLNFRTEEQKNKGNQEEQKNKDNQDNEEQCIQINVGQISKETIKKKQDNEEQKNKGNQDNEGQDNEEISDHNKNDDEFLEIRKQRSRYYLWKLHKEYELMNLNLRFRKINVIVNTIISLASIILGFFFWAISHDPNIRNVIDFGKISLSFGGFGVITNIIGLGIKFIISKNDDEKSDGNKNDNKNDDKN
ncbi:24160_t:CDS:1, partial [Gigaspora rosea]